MWHYMKCRSYSFLTEALVCDSNMNTIYMRLKVVFPTGHILAIIFGVLFAVTLLVFSIFTYQQSKKYSKYVHIISDSPPLHLT